jgi:Na+-translocating ferredoxin:NAD+ oxidoreductase RnfG subunit
MNDWIEFGKNFGVTLLMLAALAYFLMRHVWPFVTKQIEEAHAQRKEEIAKFVDTIRARDVLMAEDRREHIRALEAMTHELRSFREQLRNNHK